MQNNDVDPALLQSKMCEMATQNCINVIACIFVGEHDGDSFFDEGEIRWSYSHTSMVYQRPDGVTGDEPPHQIHSYTLLFSLFLHFPYTTLFRSNDYNIKNIEYRN